MLIYYHQRWALLVYYESTFHLFKSQSKSEIRPLQKMIKVMKEALGLDHHLDGQPLFLVQSPVEEHPDDSSIRGLSILHTLDQQLEV